VIGILYFVDQFTVIADGTRRRILDRLRVGESDVSGLIEALGSPQPLVSKHLRVLREVLGWVTPYYQLWTSSLDRLAAVLDEEAEGR
jgi:DNA-binding transcriptional ArsR family regulator